MNQDTRKRRGALRKASLIVGLVSFLLFFGLAAFFYPCTPCLAIFTGAAAGWLVAFWLKPQDQESAARAGAGAGALSGIGAIIGQMAGALVVSQLMTPDMIAETWEMLGFDALQGAQLPDTGTIFAVALSTQACCGLLNVGLMAGLGALAAVLTYRYTSGRIESQDALDL